MSIDTLPDFVTNPPRPAKAKAPRKRAAPKAAEASMPQATKPRAPRTKKAGAVAPPEPAPAPRPPRIPLPVMSDTLLQRCAQWDSRIERMEKRGKDPWARRRYRQLERILDQFEVRRKAIIAENERNGYIG